MRCEPPSLPPSLRYGGRRKQRSLKGVYLNDKKHEYKLKELIFDIDLNGAKSSNLIEIFKKRYYENRNHQSILLFGIYPHFT